MPRKKKPNLPPAGAAFAFPLGDGRYGVCRVLVGTSAKHPDKLRMHSVLVACSAWIGADVPTCDDPALRTILCPTHHSWEGKPELLWINHDEPPPELIPIGTIETTEQEQALSCNSHGRWEMILDQPLMQWRWEHERETVLAEDAAEEAAEMLERDKVQQKRREYLDRVRLEDLRDHVFFSHWKTYPPAKEIKASREVMTRTVEKLIELSRNAPKKKRLTVLQECIESFNKLDAKKGWIETDEREDICKEFEEIVHACGLGAHEDLADKWRDW